MLAITALRSSRLAHTHTPLHYIFPSPPLAFSGHRIGPPASSREHYSPVVLIIQEGWNPESNRSLLESYTLNISQLVDHFDDTLHFFSTLNFNSCTPARRLTPSDPRQLMLRSRCMRDPADCPRTPSSTPAKVSGVFFAGKSRSPYTFSVVMRHQVVIKCIWFMTISNFSIKFGHVDLLSLNPSLHLLHSRTTAGRPILSTCSLTLLDVLRNMIVLHAAQVLHQSS